MCLLFFSVGGHYYSLSPVEDYDKIISLCVDVGNRFMFAKINYATVLTHLSSLDVEKSTGSDQLSS